MAELVNLVGTVGFPIGMALLMAWYVKYSTDNANKRYDELNAQHKEELANVTNALNNNTLALQQLIEKIN